MGQQGSNTQTQNPFEPRGREYQPQTTGGLIAGLFLGAKEDVRRQHAQKQFGETLAQYFEVLGPEGQSVAEGFRTSPLETYQLLGSLGGLEKLDERLRDRMQNQQVQQIIGLAQQGDISEGDLGLVLSGVIGGEKGYTLADKVEAAKLPQRDLPQIFDMVDEFNRRKAAGSMDPWTEEIVKQAILKNATTQGTIIRETPDGLEVIVGADVGGLTIGSKTAAQKEFYMASGIMNQLTNIEKEFDPGFLQTPERAMNWMRNLASRVVELPEGEFQKAYGQATFDSLVQTVVTKFVHEFGGAQLTPFEAKMILTQVPHLDQGYAQFLAKMRTMRINMARMIARSRMYQQNPALGMVGGVEFSQVEKYVEAKADQYFDEAKQKNPDADPKDLALRVDERIGREFGVKLGWLGIGE